MTGLWISASIMLGAFGVSFMAGKEREPIRALMGWAFIVAVLAAISTLGFVISHLAWVSP